MRLISTKLLKPGMVIGRTIWNDSGRPLLQDGVQITDHIIGRLVQLNIHYVYIEDIISKDIDVQETIPLQVRHKAIQQIQDSFNSIKRATREKTSRIV